MCGRLKAFTGFCRLCVPIHHHCLLTIDLLLQFLWFGRVGLGTCHDILLGWTRHTPTSGSFLSWHLQGFVLPVCQVCCCPPAGVTRVHIELENELLQFADASERWSGFWEVTSYCWWSQDLSLWLPWLAFLLAWDKHHGKAKSTGSSGDGQGQDLRSVRLPWGNGGLCSIMKQSHCMCCIRQRGAHCFRLFRHL